MRYILKYKVLKKFKNLTKLYYWKQIIHFLLSLIINKKYAKEEDASRED